MTGSHPPTDVRRTSDRPHAGTADHFDSAAAYAVMMGEPWHALRLRSALANIRRHTSIAGLWVDHGAGTGDFAVILAAEGADSVVAADPAEAMARALSTLAERHPGIDHAAPGELPTGRADGVVLHNVIEYATDRARLFQTVAETLRPGGYASILCANPYAPAYTAAVRGASAEELLSAALGGYITVGMPGRRFRVRALSVGEAVEEASRHGLVLVEHRGVRVLSDLTPGSPEQYADTWLPEMLRIEDALGGIDPYRATARHWHLILRRKRAGVRIV